MNEILQDENRINMIYKSSLDMNEKREIVIPLLQEAYKICTNFDNMMKITHPLESELKKLNAKNTTANTLPLFITIIVAIPFYPIIYKILLFMDDVGLLDFLDFLPDILWLLMIPVILGLIGIASYAIADCLVLPLLKKPYLKKLRKKITAKEQEIFEKQVDALLYYKENEKMLAFLPEKYRYTDAVSHLLEYFSNLRVDSMKEAFNLYESELQQRQSNQHLSTISEQIRSLEGASSYVNITDI
ncbi:MAG: hypothetical protein NC347_13280 [Clostridium sp.]|nr:hypothetical protein [Clostridium sp.]